VAEIDDFDGDPGFNNVDLKLLAQKQALQYGKDLARIFVAELAKREKLQVAYQALNAIFASTPDAIVVLNEAQTIQQANQAFSDLIDQGQSSFIGRPLSEFLACQRLTRTWR
jgi:PAS domain-containing protein